MVNTGRNENTKIYNLKFHVSKIFRYILYIIYILYIYIYIYIYTDFIFHKTNFGNSTKLESIVNILVFFIKIPHQSKESHPFLNNLPLAQPHTF